MSLETRAASKVDTIDKIQKLIRANIDSYEELTEVSTQIDNPSIAALFERLALERSANAAALQNYVQGNGEVAETEGTLAASLRRVWINIRSALSDGDTYTVLTEIERCEERIQEKYDDVMAETMGAQVNELLLRQYLLIRAAHDMIRSLREQYEQPA